MADLTTKIGKLTLKNPVLAASGTFGYGLEYSHYLDLNELGGIVVKGLSLHPRNGNPPPRIMETTGGMLNSIGLQNIGVEAFITEKLPDLRRYDVAVIANIFGNTIEEYAQVARRLSAVEGIAGIEVNISCPNIKAGGIMFGRDPGQAEMLTARVRKATLLPLLVKLTPDAPDISEVARRVQDAGADAISLVNTFVGMAIDVETATPFLSTITGGLSGPAIKPLALRLVWEVARKVTIPVVGMGGIASARDALEFIIAGAHAVQVGTANFINPSICIDIINGIRDYLHAKDIQNLNHVVGSLRIKGNEAASD
ncbi:MAG: dihydroorotate dehydrogenase [Deltaproteobacteria bacterium]|nr:dihydroorotate dehydrogenase [Deltaproteobacteria bacterium]